MKTGDTVYLKELEGYHEIPVVILEINGENYLVNIINNFHTLTVHRSDLTPS